MKLKHKKDCCGCNACVLICPEQCLKMKVDHEGFNYPEIQSEKCTECGLCQYVCPVLKKTSLPAERYNSPKVLAAWNKNNAVRSKSSSGGVFSVLAEKTLELSGFVAGAVYAEDHTVRHTITNEKSQLDEIRRSKYLQSYTGNLYEGIRELLDEGIKILVCATPCQISGLYCFIGKEHPNLITCDFICRGVNSPKVFLKYLDDLQQRYGARATKVNFRNKDYGWHRPATQVDFENGKTYIKEHRDDSYMRAFIENNIIGRPCCYDCQFKGLPRQSDITLADFWGIENIHQHLDNDLGVSLILLNSKKGSAFFDKCASKLFLEESTIEQAGAHNTALVESLPYAQEREEFFKDLDAVPFSELKSKYLSKSRRHSKIKRFKTKIKKNLKHILSFLSNREY